MSRFPIPSVMTEIFLETGQDIRSGGRIIQTEITLKIVLHPSACSFLVRYAPIDRITDDRVGGKIPIDTSYLGRPPLPNQDLPDRRMIAKETMGHTCRYQYPAFLLQCRRLTFHHIKVKNTSIGGVTYAELLLESHPLTVPIHRDIYLVAPLIDQRSLLDMRRGGQEPIDKRAVQYDLRPCIVENDLQAIQPVGMLMETIVSPLVTNLHEQDQESRESHR